MLGILSNIETELVCKNVDNGDFIIMVSDGIIDSFKQEGEEEQTLIKFIEDIDNINSGYCRQHTFRGMFMMWGQAIG